ncbi:MAG: hypothetical protein EOP86_05040, partial [Verrucomicrobiaceae bacterium]
MGLDSFQVAAIIAPSLMQTGGPGFPKSQWTGRHAPAFLFPVSPAPSYFMLFRSHSQWARALFLSISAQVTISSGAPVISEFMASNKATLADEDGAFSDWIEIHNPDSAPVSLAGWKLTDNASSPDKWVFPAVTLQPGDFLVVFASGKNRTNPAGQLHTNFSLSAGGEYLGLRAPDGAVATEFTPEFPAQLDDVSCGSLFSSVNLITAGHNVRYTIPQSTTPADWTGPAFTDSTWSSGPSGIGFGLMLPGMTVKEVQTNTDLGTLALLDTALAGTPSPPRLTADTRIRQVINLLGDGGDGRFTSGNQAFVLPGETHGLRAAGYLSIPTAGAWTFGINSDDGARLRIDINNDGDFNDAGENVIVDDSGHGAQDIFGRVASLSAGSHRFELVYFENYGGDEVEFFAQKGSFTTWNTGFRLVGDTANGGLAVSTPAGDAGAGGAVRGSSALATNIQSAMRGVRSSAYLRAAFNVADADALAKIQVLGLNMRWNDGFVAWLNGVEIARRNAPEALAFDSAATAVRDTAASLTAEGINVTAGRQALVTGTNILAIQGLNTAVNDDSFLIQPELTGGGLEGGGPFYFRQPTPGTLNSTTASLGPVADTTFSVKRGIYSEPVNVTVATPTPGASIRYTMDGSKPSETSGTLVSPADDATPPAVTLNLTGTTVLRAMAYKANHDSTNVDTNTYLFPDDIIRQQPTGSPPPGWPAGSVNGQVLNYGMDPDIVNSANPAIGGAEQVKSALKAIPSVCLSVPVSSLVDSSTGIYTHAGEDGFAWEREASIEMINDPKTEEHGFQENCGIRMRGGFSRSSSNPKHAFRILFRSDYGAGKLKYPVFPDDRTAAMEFDKFDIQTSQNYSWSFQGDGANTFLRELWDRDSQLDMNQPATRGRFVNLYLNGIYWGLYQIQERAEADYAASYFGGTDDDYDVVKVETSAGYTINPTAGDLDAWTDMWNKSRASYFINTNRSPVSPYAAATYTQEQKNAAYFKLMGLAADGVTPTTDPVLVDLDNLIDYMMIVFLSGNGDAPLAGGGDFPNNFYSIRDRRGGHGFMHFQHDGEHSLNAGGSVYDRTGPYTSPINGSWNSLPRSNPQYTHQDLTPNEEYRIHFADRVHRFMVSPNGALNPQANQRRMSARAAVVETAIIAESARWGDAQRSTPFNANDWRSAVNSTLNWFINRNSIVLPQLIADGLYPAVPAPVMSQPGGAISSTEPLSMNSTSATIYYTVNGPDPRLIGGELNPAAQSYVGGAITRTDFITDGPGGSRWRYLDDGSNQGTAWKEPAFDDSAWKGPAAGQFGYGENDENTVITFGPDSGNKFITTYLRTTFDLASVSGFDNLTFEAKRDDGIVVYLNGTEIVRSNIPAGAVGHTTTADNSGDDGQEFVSFTNLPRTMLKTGTNVLAVEVHQSSGGSTDVSFDGRLFASRTTGGTQIFLNTPGLATVRARVLSPTGVWSALNEQEFLVDTEPAAAANLTVSKLMYHPAPPTVTEAAAGHTDDQSFQWLELMNTGSKAVDLRGAAFSMGIEFEFPTVSSAATLLPPGGRLLLCENTDAFLLRHGAAFAPLIAGQFTGALANGGERLVLNAADGSVIMDFTYDDADPWPEEADGAGRSLVLVSP